MALETSRIHRRLDAKLKVVGMEAHDLLFILLFAATMNLFFGSTFLATYLVFILPVMMAVVLYFVKRNKPENYFLHLLTYKMTPGVYSAGNVGKFEPKRQKRIL